MMSRCTLLFAVMTVLINVACASESTKGVPEDPPELSQFNAENADYYDISTEPAEFKLDPDKHTLFIVDGSPSELLSISSKQGAVAAWQLADSSWEFAGWIDGASKKINLYKGVNDFSIIALRPLDSALLVELGILLAPAPSPPPVQCGTQDMRGSSSDWYTVREVCDLAWIATLEKSAAKRDGKNRCIEFCGNMKCTASIPRLTARASPCVTVAADHHTRSARTGQFTCTCVR